MRITQPSNIVMRIAVLSDIHGNLPALEAVCADMDRRGVDRVVNCGDLLSGPLWPAETAERLMALDWLTLSGNHERQLLACARRPGGRSDQHAYACTTRAQQAWLAELPASLHVSPDVYACHGRLDSDLEYLLETVEAGLGSRPARADEVEQRLALMPGVGPSLVLCGHSHLPRLLQLAGLRPGGTVCVNPGSVGLPAYTDDHGAFHAHQMGSPHARYAVCERTDTGAGPGWTVVQVAVAYDWHAAAARAMHHGAPDWAHWLVTGRV